MRLLISRPLLFPPSLSLSLPFPFLLRNSREHAEDVASWSLIRIRRSLELIVQASTQRRHERVRRPRSLRAEVTWWSVLEIRRDPGLPPGVCARGGLSRTRGGPNHPRARAKVADVRECSAPWNAHTSGVAAAKSPGRTALLRAADYRFPPSEFRKRRDEPLHAEARGR